MSSSDANQFALGEVQSRIVQIEQALTTKDPMLASHLAYIHKTLIQYEELVHLLTPEQVKALVAGQKRHVQVELVKETISSKRVRVPKTTVDDL